MGFLNNSQNITSVMLYAVITGASQGIGKSIAAKLLKEGCTIIICGRDLGKLQALSNDWQKEYSAEKILCFRADLGNKNETVAFADYVLQNIPKVDILINNAGIFQPGNISDEPEGLLEQLMSVNLYSAYHLTRTLLPKMKEQKQGHIFNMCSVASLKAYPNGGSYSISKYALMGFSENLREELKPHNIKVTSVCPGATYTPSWEGSNIEPERIMEADDIAQMIWSAYNLSAQANVETIIMRPVKGDL